MMTGPMDAFNSRKLSVAMTKSEEGKLSKKVLHDALFLKMHRNSAPGLDGFTVNWLKTFWPELDVYIVYIAAMPILQMPDVAGSVAARTFTPPKINFPHPHPLPPGSKREAFKNYSPT
jgi:hypothetical protein